MSRIAKAAGVALGTGAVVLSGAGLAMADSGAQAAAVHSPGVLSGNAVQVPIHIPVNLCGNTVNVIGLLNPAFGNECTNEGDLDKGNPGPGHSHDDGHNGDHNGGHDDGKGYGS
ncbi:chaplin [Streptomyces sp. NPDC050619]|uniref:chaplin n=1 Tax=Streptomyces sp. NPDC050619 TaxID=3157214 RepID=UPI00341FAEFC